MVEKCINKNLNISESVPLSNINITTGAFENHIQNVPIKMSSFPKFIIWTMFSHN